MTIINLFSKRFGGVVGTNRISGMEHFAKIIKKGSRPLTNRRKIRLGCFIVSSYANLFQNNQDNINRLLKSIVV